MKKVLVFDFGASSARAMLCRHSEGKILLNEVHRFKNGSVREKGTLYWQIDQLFENVIEGLSKAYIEGGFDAVSIDTWGVDFGLIGKDGRLLEKPVCYRDEHTEGIPEKLYEIISRDLLYQRTGIQTMRINTIFQLYYMVLNKPDILSKAEKLLMMPDLFCYMLTGVYKSEYTEATTSQLVNAQTGDWDYEMMDILSIPKRLFSPLIKAGENYGLLTEEVCKKANLPESYKNVPVIAAPSHDTSSAVVAVPASEKDFLFVSCGTWTLFGTELEKPIISQKTNELNLTNEGGYNKTTTFLKNIMGLWLIQESKRYYKEVCGKDYSFGDLENMARKEAPFRSFIDPNANEFSTPENMPLKIADFCKNTNQPVPQNGGQIIRCIYESLALEFARTYEEISEITGISYEKLYMFGGGTKDKMLCQSASNALGKKVVAGPAEATATGNAISSFVALNEISSVSEARKNLSQSDEILTYEPENHNEWKNALEKYKSIVKN